GICDYLEAPLEAVVSIWWEWNTCDVGSTRDTAGARGESHFVDRLLVRHSCRPTNRPRNHSRLDTLCVHAVKCINNLAAGNTRWIWIAETCPDVRCRGATTGVR